MLKHITRIPKKTDHRQESSTKPLVLSAHTWEVTEQKSLCDARNTVKILRGSEQEKERGTD